MLPAENRAKRVEIVYRRKVMEAGAEVLRLLTYPDDKYAGIGLNYSELLAAVRDECTRELEVVAGEGATDGRRDETGQTEGGEGRP